jgi:hypothetical protein
LTGNGGEVIPFHSKKYTDLRQREQFHSSDPDGQNVGFFPHCWIPEDPVNCTGGIHYQNMSDATINVNIGNAAGESDIFDVLNGTSIDGSPAENVLLDVIVEVPNWLHFVGGDVNRTFN